MSIAVSGATGPQSVEELIQQNWLKRKFEAALFPALQWRRDVPVERWEQNRGQEMLMTRNGLIEPNTNPLTPGTDPTPSSYDSEQWRVIAQQNGNTLDTSMPTSFVALRSLALENANKLGLNAGQTINRIIRDRLMTAYLGGQTNAINAVAAGLSQIPVASVNGFTEQLFRGRPTPVSAVNPINVSFSTVGEPVNQVIGASPADPSKPNGAGLITLAQPLTVGVAQRDVINSQNQAVRRRSGGSASIDGITATSMLKVADLRAAVTRLRRTNVPTFPDGRYRCIIDPVGVDQLYADNEWQRLQQSLPDGAYKDFNLAGAFVDSLFIMDNETPNLETVNPDSLQETGGLSIGSSEIGADLVNASGVPVARAIMFGMEQAVEYRIPEADYLTQAGVTGQTGAMSGIQNGNYIVPTEGIRYIWRAPLDRLQQVVSMSWSWSGDFGIPSDQTTGDGARFKRAVVIEHAGAGA